MRIGFIVMRGMVLSLIGGCSLGAHSNRERLREDALYKFIEFEWGVLTTIAVSK